MEKPTIKSNITRLGSIHMHTDCASGYLRYKKIIENIKAHVLYIYFGIPNYI